MKGRKKDAGQTTLMELLGGIRSRAEDDGMIRRAFGITVKAGTLNKEGRSVRVIASTDAIDSYDESVEQKWDLSRFEKNPVVLYGHNRNGFLGMGGDPEKTLPIGFATDTGVVDGHLEATLNFVDAEATPMAEKVWQGFLQGSIRAVSVGFYPRSVREERRDDKDLLILSDNELWEISAVPLPANAEAVALSNDETKRERAGLLARARGKAAPAKNEDNAMNEAQLKAEIERLEKALKEASTEAAATKAELEKLKADLADAKSNTENRKVVRALLGKKLREDQLDDFCSLRLASPDTFESIVKGLPDLEDESQKAAEAAVDALGDGVLPAQRDAFIKLHQLDAELFTEVTSALGKSGVGSKLTTDVLPKDKAAKTNSATTKRRPSTLLQNAEKAGNAAASKLAS